MSQFLETISADLKKWNFLETQLLKIDCICSLETYRFHLSLSEDISVYLSAESDSTFYFYENFFDFIRSLATNWLSHFMAQVAKLISRLLVRSKKCDLSSKTNGLSRTNLQGPLSGSQQAIANPIHGYLQLALRSVDNIISKRAKMYCSGTCAKSKHNLFKLTVFSSL